MKMGQEMWPLECLRANVNGRTDIQRTKTGHKSSPEQSGELKIIKNIYFEHLENTYNIGLGSGPVP